MKHEQKCRECNFSMYSDAGYPVEFYCMLSGKLMTKRAINKANTCYSYEKSDTDIITGRKTYTDGF